MCRLCRARGVGGPFALVENDPPSSSHVDDDAFVPCRVARSVLAEASPHHHRSHRRVDAPGSAARVARVVVGAGVAGACAAEELCRLAPDDDVVLVAATDAVKAVLDVERVTRRLSVVNVVERPIDSALAYENIRVARGVVTGMDPAARTLTLKLKRAPPTSGDERDARREGEGEGEGDEETTLRYDQLFVCVGAAPVVPEACRGDVAASVTRTVRDVEDVTGMCDALRRARRALLVGNGGIAMEIVGALCGGDGGGGGGGGDDDAPASDAPPPRELVWAHRHSTVGDSFFDRDAGAFLMGLLSRGGTRRDGRSRGGNAAEKTRKRRRRGKDDGDGEDEDAAGVVEGGTSTVGGGAAGPSWVKTMTSALESGTREPFALRPRPDVELRAVEAAGDDDDDADGFAAVAVLSDGERVPVDLIIVAAGVDPAPRVAFLPRDVYARGDDGGVEVDACFRAKRAAAAGGGVDPRVFVAGDAACATDRTSDPSTRWHQTRLWSQARHAGTFAARVATDHADEDAFGFNYELFTHVTSFFGLKTILLGSYNAQTMEGEPEEDVVMYVRQTYDPAPCFIRVLLLRGRMMGAVLIGDTGGLEETFENLILDRIDLSRWGPALLDPEFDVEDFFD